MFEYLSDFLRQKNHEFAKGLMIFSAVFFVVFTTSFIVLGVLGFIPTEFQSETKKDTIAARITESTYEGLGLSSGQSSDGQNIASSFSAEAPTRIVASSISLDTEIVHPASANFTVLNEALGQGAVYYPGSGLAGKGNMFIFGHSTSYQYVNNKAYQVFNKVKDLKKGDTIEVFGENRVYVYKVRDVKLVNADTELVSFSTANMLTISTCNSFGQKTDRYVAEADFVESHTI